MRAKTMRDFLETKVGSVQIKFNKGLNQRELEKAGPGIKTTGGSNEGKGRV